MNIVTKLYIEIPPKHENDKDVLVDIETINAIIKDLESSDTLPGLTYINIELLKQIQHDLTSNDI